MDGAKHTAHETSPPFLLCGFPRLALSPPEDARQSTEAQKLQAEALTSNMSASQTDSNLHRSSYGTATPPRRATKALDADLDAELEFLVHVLAHP